jgi:hypothetical protein
MALPRRPLTHFAVIAAGRLHERIGPGGSPRFDFALMVPRQNHYPPAASTGTISGPVVTRKDHPASVPG